MLGCEDPVLFVDGDSHQRIELARQLAVRGADIRQQTAFTIEDLKPVLHLVGHPDVSIPVYRDALGPGEVSWAVTVLAEEADKASVRIEDLHPIVEGVRDVYIAVLVQSDALRRAEVAWRGEVMVLAAGANSAQQLER